MFHRRIAAERFAKNNCTRETVEKMFHTDSPFLLFTRNCHRAELSTYSGSRTIHTHQRPGGICLSPISTGRASRRTRRCPAVDLEQEEPSSPGRRPGAGYLVLPEIHARAGELGCRRYAHASRRSRRRPAADPEQEDSPSPSRRPGAGGAIVVWSPTRSRIHSTAGDTRVRADVILENVGLFDESPLLLLACQIFVCLLT
jgi:hypothetical protein